MDNRFVQAIRDRAIRDRHQSAPPRDLREAVNRCLSQSPRDSLWTLGGELIRCRYDDDELAGKNVKDALRQLIEGDGGPLMWPRISESEQDSLDATCRKLNRFLREQAARQASD
jgi:hypothetical protein